MIASEAVFLSLSHVVGVSFLVFRHGPRGMTSNSHGSSDWEGTTGKTWRIISGAMGSRILGVSGTDSIGLLQIGESFLVCVRDF